MCDSGEVACLSLGGGGGGGANTQTAAPPPPPPRTHNDMLPFCQNFLSEADAGFRRGGGGFHMNHWRKGGARAKGAKILMVTQLNTNTALPYRSIRVSNSKTELRIRCVLFRAG